MKELWLYGWLPPTTHGPSSRSPTTLASTQQRTASLRYGAPAPRITVVKVFSCHFRALFSAAQKCRRRVWRPDQMLWGVLTSNFMPHVGGVAAVPHRAKQVGFEAAKAVSGRAGRRRDRAKCKPPTPMPMPNAHGNAIGCRRARSPAHTGARV